MKTCWKILLVVVVSVIFFLAGCANTVNGFGKFVGGIGDDIQDASSKQVTASSGNRVEKTDVNNR